MKPFNDLGEFQQEVTNEGAGIRRLAVRGVAATLLSSCTGLGVQVLSAVILARLLMPGDFGLVTMVTTFSLLFVNFGLNGFTEAIIQRKEINHKLASNLFWINVIGSSFLAICFAVAGGLLSRLFGDPRIVAVTGWMSLTIFFTGLSVIHLGLLKRAMRFTIVSANDMFARAVSIVVSICLAWASWGYWSLVAGAVVLAACIFLGAWVLCRWIPGMPHRATGTWSMIRFAINAYGRFSTGYFTNNLDNVLVGWRLGPASLGLYKKAYDLFGLPSSQLSCGLTVVAVSALSRLRQDVGQYKQCLVSALGVMAFIGMAISGDFTLIGKDLILVLLGPRWIESGRLFTIFAPGIGFMLLYCTHIWIHLSLGNADRWLHWGIVDLLVTTVFLCVGLHWNAEGIAVAWVVSYLVITLPALWYAGKPIELEVITVIAATWRYVIASLTAGYAVYLVLRANPAFMSDQSVYGAFVRLSIVSLVFFVLYLSCVILLHRSLAPISQISRLLLEMTNRSASQQPALFTEREIINYEELVLDRIGKEEKSKECMGCVK